MPKAIKRAESVAAKIRRYIAENPHKTVPEVAAACGVKYQRAYVVKKDMEKKLSELAYEIGKGRKPKSREWMVTHVSTSDNSIEKVMERETLKLPKVGDIAGGLVFTKLSNGKFRWMAPKPIEAPPVQLEMFEPASDPVNHPAHYKVGGIETIDFIEAKRLNYNMGNAVKYITRADHKGSRKQDLEKAIWYLRREIEHSV